MLITAYLKVTKEVNNGHCGMEAETYLQFLQHAVHLFLLEHNEETKWTKDKMESYLMIRTKSSDFVEIKNYILDGLINRGYVVAVVKMYANDKQLDDTLMMNIMERRFQRKMKKEKGLLGWIKRFTWSEDAIGTNIPDEYDEELWEDEENV